MWSFHLWFRSILLNATMWVRIRKRCKRFLYMWLHLPRRYKSNRFPNLLTKIRIRRKLTRTRSSLLGRVQIRLSLELSNSFLLRRRVPQNNVLERCVSLGLEWVRAWKKLQVLEQRYGLHCWWVWWAAAMLEWWFGLEVGWVSTGAISCLLEWREEI